MNLTISIESPRSESAIQLVNGSEAVLRALYRPEECFSFDINELDQPNVDFYVARLDENAVGCVALVNWGNYGEVKRLFVTPEARGRAVGAALMDRVESDAATSGMLWMRLETGEKLSFACDLYRARDYSERGPFGAYSDEPTSLFMEKRLA